MGTLANLLARLDPDSGIRRRQFELICRWYLTTDPLYRREPKRVWLWDEWPGRWGADAGIDLVAEARDGGLWAIQAKAYDPRYPIKKSDVDTFLSESARPQFSFRLLIATTNEIGTTARRTLEAQEKPGHLLFLADLDRAAMDWPAHRACSKARPPSRSGCVRISAERSAMSSRVSTRHTEPFVRSRNFRFIGRLVAIEYLEAGCDGETRTHYNLHFEGSRGFTPKVSFQPKDVKIAAA
jgi:hypothetical protein